jgi:hypothetical protein
MQETKVKIIDAFFLAEENSAKDFSVNRVRSAGARFFCETNAMTLPLARVSEKLRTKVETRQAAC